MRLALAALGFTSTVAQVLLMREMVATFYGNELLFGLVLTAWLAWVAAGSWGLSRVAGAGRLGEHAFAGGLALAAACLPVQMALVRGTRPLLGVISGAFVPLGSTALAVIISLAPLCLLVGLLFAVGARLTEQRGGTAGQAYVWESAGALSGGALFSFVLIRWLDPFQVALLVVSVDFAVGLRMCLRGLSPARRRPPVLPLAVLVVMLLGALPLGRRLHRVTVRWPWAALGAGLGAGRSTEPGSQGSAYELVFAEDSPYGRLTVWAQNRQRVFYQNGLLAFETQTVFPEEVTHFPLLVHPSPKEVLLVGGGVSGDLREALKHPVDGVTYVELDPLLIEAALQHLPAELASDLNDPRVSVALGDGRLFLRRTSRTFDVVILDVPAPSTGALNRFYTSEFFEEVGDALNRGGILSLALPSAENYWGPELARRNASIYQTLRTVFPEVVVLPGEHNLFLASHAALPVAPEVLHRRLSERELEVRRVTPDYVSYVLGTDRFKEVNRSVSTAKGIRINRDMSPVCYYYNLTLWLSRFYPGALQRLDKGIPLVVTALVLPLALIVLSARRRRRWAVPVAIAAIGLAEMLLEVVILFAFQVLRGTIYAEVSLIVTGFMAGLAVGGGAGNRILDRAGRRGHPDRGGAPSAGRPTADQGLARRALIGVQVGVVIYGGLLPFLLSLPIPVPRLVFPLLALVAGALAGMAFPLGMAAFRGQRDRAAGLLYGADLVGGCLGALLGAAFLVPLLGIPSTCAGIALVGLAGIVVLV